MPKSIKISPVLLMRLQRHQREDEPMSDVIKRLLDHKESAERKSK